MTGGESGPLKVDRTGAKQMTLATFTGPRERVLGGNRLMLKLALERGQQASPEVPLQAERFR